MLVDVLPEESSLKLNEGSLADTMKTGYAHRLALSMFAASCCFDKKEK
jgi:hypothetical protein